MFEKMHESKISLGKAEKNYVSPTAVSYSLSAEQPILSYSREGDNEKTREEDLF